MKVMFKGTPVSLGAQEINVGDLAPQITVVGKDLSHVIVGGKLEKTQLIITVPSLDTDVCSSETRKFNEEAAKIKDVSVFVISQDLPFAAGKFCATAGIGNLSVGSDFKNKAFSKKYGVLIQDGPLEGLSARAIFVIDKNGILVYKEIVKEITSEPHYENALSAAKKA